MTDATTAKHRFRLPVLQGVLPFDRASLSTDIIAGITLAALAIPEVMGYTKIAGMPVITGLYTILLPIAVFALLGSSRHLVVGADSATAAIMFAGMVGMAATGSSEYVALAGWLALLTAGFLLAARLLRLGFLANFLSRTMLVGFLTGVGVQVACGQIAGMLGVPKSGKGPILQAWDAIVAIPKANLATVAVSAAVLIVIVGSGLISKKIPGALIAVIGAIVASWWLDLTAKGVTTLGTIPSGLPHFGVPALPHGSQWLTLATTAGSIFLVVLAQSAATSRAYAVKYDDHFDENIDLVGLSFANVAAGLSGTFVVNGSPTKTEMVDSAGGKSQISQLTTSAIVLIVLLLLTRPLSFMPNAVLAAVVFLIGVKLVDVKGMRVIYKTRPAEFWVALITAATVVVVGVEQGILLAIALSVVIHLRHSYHPYNVVLDFVDGELRLEDVADCTQVEPGLLIYHFGASLYYANAESFAADVLQIVDAADPPLKWLAIECSAMQDIDFTAAAVLAGIIKKLKATKDVHVVFVDVLPPVRRELEEGVLAGVVGPHDVFESPRTVINAYLHDHHMPHDDTIEPTGATR